MDLNQYYNMPEGANMYLRYSSFFDTVGDGYPLPNESYLFYWQSKREVVKPLNTSKVTNMNNMFGYNSLKYWDNVENFDVSNVTDMGNMFNNCEFTKVYSRNWNTSKVTDMNNMFYGVATLEEFDVNWDTSKVTNFNRFISSSVLKSLCTLDCSSVTTKNYYPVYYFSNQTALTDVGGFLNMKMSWDNTYGLSKLPNLTYQSCINILNGLYDFTGNGETPNSNQGTLKVHQNFLTTVGDEIAIGINKGWKITA